MKKLFLAAVFTAAAVSSGFAGDFNIFFEDARFHRDLLFGAAPLYFRAGVDYSGFELIEDQKTDLCLIAGGALVSTELWTDEQGHPFTPSAENNTTDEFYDLNSYSRWQGDLGLKFKQGFIHEEGRENAFFAVYAKYALHVSDPHPSLIDDPLTPYFLSADSSVYPDNQGALVNSLQAGIEVDRLDRGDVNSGYNADLSVLYSPRWFFNDIVGDSDFVNVNFTLKAYYPVLQLLQPDNELTMLGIYLADRVQADYITGEAISQFHQEAPSLGEKMRGFEDNSMGTEFTIVNNFDIRFYGFEFVDEFNPVMVLFCDVGFFSGKYYNTDLYAEGEFVCSAGFEILANMLDLVQVGLRFGFPLIGENMQEKTMLPRVAFTYKYN